MNSDAGQLELMLLVGHSHGGGVAWAAAVVLLASARPGGVSQRDTRPGPAPDAVADAIAAFVAATDSITSRGWRPQS
jgi:hypothetical protein